MTHATRVLRLRPDDEIVAVDGRGGWYRVRLDYTDRRNASGQILERRRDVGEPSYHLTLAVGLTKQRARFEMLLEKAAELGVGEIVPLITERTERETVRLDRLESKLVAAMKQCGRCRLIGLREPVPFGTFLGEAKADLSLCCHEAADQENHIMGILRKLPIPERIAGLIGPEGGFSQREILEAAEHDFAIVSLAPRRLRTETAAIAVAAAISLTYDSSNTRGTLDEGSE